jgi:Predicted transcriptional regulators
MTVAEKLIELRNKSGKTQAEVSEDLNISQSCLGNYEAGIRVPKDEMKVKIADYYGLTVQEIFFD